MQWFILNGPVRFWRWSSDSGKSGHFPPFLTHFRRFLAR